MSTPLEIGHPFGMTVNEEIIPLRFVYYKQNIR